MKRVIRRIIRYANLVAAIFLVLSFLSPHVSPAKLWGPSFLGLAYPYILLLNLLLMLFWIVMKKREFIISLLAILLGWNTLMDYIGLHAGAFFRKAYYEHLDREERDTLGQMKVMSFNVRAFDQYRWAEKPTTRAEIIRMLGEEDPDILCLQEFFITEKGPYSAGDLFKALPGTAYRHIEYTANTGRNKYGIAIFSHYPIAAAGRVEINSSRSICSFADIRVKKDTIRVYNMHLQSIRLNSRNYRIIDSLKFRYDSQQMEEIKDISYRLRDAFIIRAGQADRIAEHIGQCPFPLIVCGDFNDTPVSYTYHRIRDGMGDAFTECGWGMGRTYIGKFPSFRIDYILFGAGLEALHFSRKKVRLSDHFPITGYLSLISD